MNNDMFVGTQFLREEQEESGSRVRAALTAGDGLDAARVARSRELAAKLGLPEPVVREDMAGASLEETAATITSSPLLASWAVQDEARAALARDDAPALKGLFDAIGEGKGIAYTFGRIEANADALGAALWRGNKQQELSDLGGRLRHGDESVLPQIEAIQKETAAAAAHKPGAGTLVDALGLTSATEQLPRMIRTTVPSATEALGMGVAVYGATLAATTGGGAAIGTAAAPGPGTVAGGVAGFMGGQPGAVAAGTTAATTTYLIQQMRRSYEMERNSFVADLAAQKDTNGKPLDPALRNAAADAYGAAAAIIETTSEAMFLRLLRPVGGAAIARKFGQEGIQGFVKSAVRRAVLDTSVRARLLEIGAKVAGGAVLEGMEEGLQEIASILTEYGVKEAAAVTGDNFFAGNELFTKENAAQVAESFTEAFRAGIWLQGGPIAVSHAARITGAREANRFAERYGRIHEKVEATKTKALSPDYMAEALEHAGERGLVHVPADAALELYQQGTDILTPLGISPEQAERGAALGHAFEVPMSQVLARLDTPQFQAAARIFRQAPGGMSTVEAARLDLSRAEDAGQVLELYQSYKAEEADYQAERARLHEGFTRAIEAAPGLAAQAEGMAGSVSAYLDHALALADAALPRLAALSGESRASVLARIVPQMLGAKRPKPSKTPLVDAVHDANAVADMEAAGFVFDDAARGLPAVEAPEAAGMTEYEASLQQRFERQHKRRPLAERDPVLAHVWGRLDGKSLKAYDTHGYKDVRAVRGMGLFRSAEKGGQSLDLLADEMARSGLLPEGSGANELLAYLRGDGLELHQADHPADVAANKVVGAITPEVASFLPLNKPGDIVLLPEAVRHIEEEHGEQIRGLGYADAREFVNYVLSHVDAVYQGSTKRSFELVTRQTQPQGRVVSKLEFAEEGDHYRITTAGPVRQNNYKNRTPLWERAHPTLFQEENPSAARRASQRGQSGERLNLTTLHAGVKIIRGATAMRDGAYYVRLMQRADLSTLPHEFSHVFLLEWQRVMDSGVTDAAALADWQTARKWLGAEDGAAFTREQHEQFARGFEAYLMEGKAPAPELAGTFARFKRWLLAIYKDAKNLGVELDDGIRGVFDRMLATEQQIEEAAAVNELYSLTEAQLDALGVVGKDRVYAAGLMDIAKERGLARMQEDLDKERGARLKAWATEAQEELAADRVYQARSELYGKQQDGEDTGPWLDVDAVRESFGERVAADLRRALGGFALRAGGQDPEIMAARHGFISGADLIGSLVVSEPRARRIKALMAEKEAAFEAARAEGMNPAGYILEAEEAVAQVEFVGRYLASSLVGRDAASGIVFASGRGPEESTPIGKNSPSLPDAQPGRYHISRQAFARVAADELDGMVMGKAVSQPQFLAALRRALRDERRAVASGDFYAALEANHKARLNLEFVRRSRDMERLQQKTARRIGRFVGMGKADPDARYLVMDIAMRHGLGKYNARLAEGREAATPRDWLAAREADGYSLFVDDAVLYGPGKPWKEMTAGEFASLAETVAQVAAVERNARQLLTGAKRQALDDAAGAIADSILSYRTAQPQKTVEKDGALTRGAGYGHAVHTKIEALCVSLDGGKTLGPTWEHIFRPIAEADDARAMRFKEVRDALRGSGLFGMYTRKELAGMGKAKTFIEEVGETLTREQQIAVALNMGNEGNYARLQQGHGWDDAQIAAVVDGLTKKDWDFVQAVWDYIGSFREEAFALHESITGLRPKAVEARPLMTPHGQYAGGYYPVRYDADKSFRAFAREQKAFDQELFGGRNHGAAMTKKGHLQDRAGKGAGTPLLLELSVITDHIFNVVHDLSFRKPVMDVAKIIGHAKVRTAIETTVGHAQYRELRPWLQDVAGERQEPMHFLHRGARWARASTSIMQMGYKFTTMFTQPLGFTQSVEVLGYRYAGRGLKTVYGNPLRLPDLVEATFAKSAFMAQRLGSFDREVRDITKKLHHAGRFAWVDAVRDNAFVPMGVFQMGVDLPTWWGAYEKGMKEHGGDEGKAVRYADSAVRLSQGSGATKDLARIQRGGEFGRLATMFYSYFNTMYNLAALRFADLKRDRGPAAVFRAANTALLLWFVPAALSELAAGRGPDDDEEPWEWAAEQVLAYPFMAVVGVRDIAGAMASGFGYQVTPGKSAPASLVRWFATVNKALEKDEWDEKKLAVATTEAVGYLARLPLKQAIISVGNVWDYLSGDDPDFEVRDLFFVKPKSRRRP